MRSILKKTAAVAAIGAAALAVSACGKTETTNTSENVSMTDMNAMAPEGSMNDMAATDMGNTSGNGSEMMGDNASNMM